MLPLNFYCCWSTREKTRCYLIFFSTDDASTGLNKLENQLPIDGPVDPVRFTATSTSSSGYIFMLYPYSNSTSDPFNLGNVRTIPAFNGSSLLKIAFDT